MIIDAHHHFWKYDAETYPWIGDDMNALRRDFLPPLLRAEIGRAGIDGVVTVQARQTLEETEWLLELAGKYDFIKGVVGWVPLAHKRLHAHLEKYCSLPKFKGVRHVLQDESDDRYMLQAKFNEGITALKEYGLVYDLLVYHHQLPRVIEFVDRHPEQVFVLDHIGKPNIRERAMEPWRKDIRALALRKQVYCKISGLVTEAVWKTWNDEQLLRYMEEVINAFGPERCMFGSDWPVCLVASEYNRWFRLVSGSIKLLSDTEQARIMGGTAVDVYGLA